MSADDWEGAAAALGLDVTATVGWRRKNRVAAALGGTIEGLPVSVRYYEVTSGASGWSEGYTVWYTAIEVLLGQEPWDRRAGSYRFWVEGLAAADDDRPGVRTGDDEFDARIRIRANTVARDEVLDLLTPAARRALVELIAVAPRARLEAPLYSGSLMIRNRPEEGRMDGDLIVARVGAMVAAGNAVLHRS